MTPTSSARTSRADAGYTLAELLVAVTLALVVTGLIYRSLQIMQSTTRAQSERSALQGNLRLAGQLMTAELEELQVNSGAGTSDIVNMSDTSITYRAMRGAGMTCS